MHAQNRLMRIAIRDGCRENNLRQQCNENKITKKLMQFQV